MIAGLHLMMPEFKINKQEFLYVCTSIVYRLDHVEVCWRKFWNRKKKRFHSYLILEYIYHTSMGLLGLEH